MYLCVINKKMYISHDNFIFFVHPDQVFDPDHTPLYDVMMLKSCYFFQAVFTCTVIIKYIFISGYKTKSCTLPKFPYINLTWQQILISNYTLEMTCHLPCSLKNKCPSYSVREQQTALQWCIITTSPRVHAFWSRNGQRLRLVL